MFNKKEKVIIKIEGMKCEHCAKKVEEVLLKNKNVKKVKVFLEEKEALITFNGELDKESIIHDIEELDYKVLGFKEV